MGHSRSHLLEKILVRELSYENVTFCNHNSFQHTEGHGRLLDPPSRASMWRFGYDNPKDYNDNQGFCGGRIYQIQQGGNIVNGFHGFNGFLRF